MPIPLITAVARIEGAGEPTGREVFAALDSVTLPPVETLRCMNPECPNMCTWTKGRGRPRYFCSGACKQNFQLTRARVADEVALLEVACRDQNLTYVQARRLAAELAHRRWQLRHYSIEPT